MIRKLALPVSLQSNAIFHNRAELKKRRMLPFLAQIQFYSTKYTSAGNSLGDSAEVSHNDPH